MILQTEPRQPGKLNHHSSRSKGIPSQTTNQRASSMPTVMGTTAFDAYHIVDYRLRSMLHDLQGLFGK